MQLPKSDKMTPKTKKEKMTPKSSAKKENQNKKLNIEAASPKLEAKLNLSQSKMEKKKRRKQRRKEAGAQSPAASPQKQTPGKQTPGNVVKPKDKKNGVQTQQTQVPLQTVTVQFPSSRVSCKDALLKVINIAERILPPRYLCLEFNSVEEANKKAEIISKLDMGGKRLKVKPLFEEEDPLKRIVFIVNESTVESVKKFFNPKEMTPMGGNPKRPTPRLYVLTFKSVEDATAASKKKLKLENNKTVELKTFFNRRKSDQKAASVSSAEPDSKKRKLDGSETAQNAKKKLQTKVAIKKDEEDDEDMEDDDDEEDEDEEEEEDDEEEEEDEDDDDDDDDDE